MAEAEAEEAYYHRAAKREKAEPVVAAVDPPLSREQEVGLKAILDGRNVSHRTVTPLQG